MPSDKYALSKRRYHVSSSDEEPVKYKSRSIGKQERPAPKAKGSRPPAVVVDISSDDEDLFKPRRKDSKQASNGKGVFRPYNARLPAKEKSSSDSDLDFQFDYRAAARHQRNEKKKEAKPKPGAARNPQDSDTCTSCTGSECDGPRKCPKPTGQRLLERSQQHIREKPDYRRKPSGARGFESDKPQHKAKAQGRTGGALAYRKATDVVRKPEGPEEDSLDSSDDIFLGAARSCKLLERHIQRHESQKKEFRTISSNDEFLRRTFQENLSPRSEQLRRQRAAWPSDEQGGITARVVPRSTKTTSNTGKSQPQRRRTSLQTDVSRGGSAIAYCNRPQLEHSSFPSKRKHVKSEVSGQGCFPIQEGPEGEEHMDHEKETPQKMVKDLEQAPVLPLHPRELMRPTTAYSGAGGPRLVWDKGVLRPLPVSETEPRDKENIEVHARTMGLAKDAPHTKFTAPGVHRSQFRDQATSPRRSASSEIGTSKRDSKAFPAPLQRARSEIVHCASMDSDKFAHVAGAAVRVMSGAPCPEEESLG